MEILHLCPVHLRPEMMLGVIAIVEEEPVIDSAITAHPPGDRLLRVRPIMAKVAVQVTETVTEIEKGQEIKDDVAPVKPTQYQEGDDYGRQLNITLAHF